MAEVNLDLLRASWQRFMEGVGTVLPGILSLLAILLVGWIVALLVRLLVRWLVSLLHLDTRLLRTEEGMALERMGVPRVERLIASLAFWLVLFAFLLSGLRVLGVEWAEELARDVILFAPRLVAALAIVLVGFLLSGFLWRVLLLGAVNARVPNARLLADVVRAIALLGVVAMALEQIDVGGRVLHTLFALVAGGVVLALALAFGLGGRHVARRFLEGRLLPHEEKKPDEPPHL